MDIGLAIYSSNEVPSEIIEIVSNDLNVNYKDKNFGEGVLTISIGIICVSEQFEKFFKPRKVKYIKDRREKEIDGIKIVYERSLEYDCILNYKDFMEANDLQKRNLLENIIFITTKEVLSTSKIKNFRESEFLSDLKSFFETKKENNL